MLEWTTASRSDNLSLAEVLHLLQASPLVDGIAEFGSHAGAAANAASDYDLLVLVHDLPAPVFQLVTTIDGRLADIVPIDITVADRLLADSAVDLDRFDQLFLQKMVTAKIRFDHHNRLTKLQQLSQVVDQARLLSPLQDEASRYSAWFWQSFGLLHLERMAASPDPIYQTAADMMLLSCLAGTWRAYFELRGILWTGEKAALRYWLQHDLVFYQLVQAVFTAGDRTVRLTAYKELINHAVKPSSVVMQKGRTAVMLNAVNDRTKIDKVVTYWNSLVEK